MRNRPSTTEIGNILRDRLRDLLAASGFSDVETEIHIRHKNVDVVAKSNDITGYIIEGYEAKNLSRNVNTEDAKDFVADYGPLTESGELTRAWLIASNDISPSAREYINLQNIKGLYCATIAEFENKLFALEKFLSGIEKEYQHSNLEQYYIPARSGATTLLQTHIENWLEIPEAKQYAIIGGYGRGKSTFALYLAAELIKKAKLDPNARQPILIRLGEISDEQSIKGLFGKVLASTHAFGVKNYNFETFRELNRRGRFLIIYDGFDEMKYGMTFPVFQKTFKELMSLDEGNAKIIILGRDTAFHHDREFQSVIKGRAYTAAGNEVPERNYRGCDHLYIEEFTPSETRNFIRRYFPIRAKEEKSHNPHLADEWVVTRCAEIEHFVESELAAKPVHAQMLCDIATNPNLNLQQIDEHKLYDQFIHYLFDREITKMGRDADINIDARRIFTSNLAAWLWSKAGAVSTSIPDIPDSIIASCSEQAKNKYDSIGLRREMIAGCLIEKQDDKIYFGHRSIQEFLVAEYLLKNQHSQNYSLGELSNSQKWEAITQEVSNFFAGGLHNLTINMDEVSTWFDSYDAHLQQNGSILPLHFLSKLYDYYSPKSNQPMTFSPSFLWAAYFSDNNITDWFSDDHANLRMLLLPYSHDTLRTVASSLFWGYRLSIDEKMASVLAPTAVAAIMPLEKLKSAISASQSIRAPITINRESDFMLWLFLKIVKVINIDGTQYIELNIMELIGLCEHKLSKRFDLIGEAEIFTPQFPVQWLYQTLSSNGVTEKELEHIRPFFNDDRLRERLKPLIVQGKPRKRQVNNATP